MDTKKGTNHRHTWGGELVSFTPRLQPIVKRRTQQLNAANAVRFGYRGENGLICAARFCKKLFSERNNRFCDLDAGRRFDLLKAGRWIDL